jgi:hypothetical protein
MLFSPVIPNEDHQLPPSSILLYINLFGAEDTRRRANGSVLDRHDIPSALQVTSPTGRGTI